MRVRINLQILDDNYAVVEEVSPEDVLFLTKITPETVANAQAAVAASLERHTRKHKAFDALLHWDGKGYSLSRIA